MTSVLATPEADVVVHETKHVADDRGWVVVEKA
jgi:hypothetical protein